MLLCVGRSSICFITIIVSTLRDFVSTYVVACTPVSTLLSHRGSTYVVACNISTIRFLKTFLLLCHSSPMYSVVNFITTIIFEGLARCKDIFVAISVAHLSITLSLTIICNKFHYTFKETHSRVNKVLVKWNFLADTVVEYLNFWVLLLIVSTLPELSQNDVLCEAFFVKRFYSTIWHKHYFFAW